MEMNLDMNQMMQMMQTMMMTQMMQMFQSGQMGQLPVLPSSPTVQNPNIQASTINAVENSEIQDLKAQIAALEAQLKEAKLDLAAERQTHEATKKALKYSREENTTNLIELSNLKKVVARAEVFLGKSISDIAENVEELGGDDYYEAHKKEWNEEGISNKEKHDRIKSYRNLFKDAEEDDDDIDMINF